MTRRTKTSSCSVDSHGNLSRASRYQISNFVCCSCFILEQRDLRTLFFTLDSGSPHLSLMNSSFVFPLTFPEKPFLSGEQEFRNAFSQFLLRGFVFFYGDTSAASACDLIVHFNTVPIAEFLRDFLAEERFWRVTSSRLSVSRSGIFTTVNRRNYV